MNLKKYKYSASDTYLDFEFDSDGPKGKVRKVIQFYPKNENGTGYYCSYRVGIYETFP